MTSQSWVGEGIKNCPELRNVIYGRALRMPSTMASFLFPVKPILYLVSVKISIDHIVMLVDHNICLPYFLYHLYYYYHFLRFFIQSNYFSIYLQTHPHTINSCQAKHATHVNILWHMKMHIISFAHTHALIRIYTHLHTLTHIHTSTFSIPLSHTHILCVVTCTHTHTSTVSHSLSLKHTHTHFLHTHTRTRTRMYILYLRFLIHWCMTFVLVVYLFNQIPKFISIVNVNNWIWGLRIYHSHYLLFRFSIFVYQFWTNWNVLFAIGI